jgi:hypothetical protein
MNKPAAIKCKTDFDYFVKSPVKFAKFVFKNKGLTPCAYIQKMDESSQSSLQKVDWKIALNTNQFGKRRK